MSLVRAVAPELLRPVEINDLALNTTLYYAADLSYTALDIGLSSALFGASLILQARRGEIGDSESVTYVIAGVLTFLVILAVVFLTRKGLSHTFVRILLSSTLLLYGSGVLYMAALASHVVSVDRLVAQARAGLLSEAFTTAEVEAFESDVLKQSWMMTIALIMNVLISDSIVWWRVCAVWRNRVIYCIGPLVIALTIAFAGKALWGMDHCLGSCRQPQFLFSAGVFAGTSVTLSLLVNLVATGLIAHKAWWVTVTGRCRSPALPWLTSKYWAHWRLLRECLGRGQHKSRVVSALALLVESGAIYCILLIFLIVYEASPALFAEPGVHQSAFFRTIADYTYACCVYTIAIYPVLIIVIVALKWSPLEQGFVHSIHITDRSRNHSTPMHFRSLDGATIETTGTAHMVYVLDGRDDASDAAAKSALVNTGTGTDENRNRHERERG